MIVFMLKPDLIVDLSKNTGVLSIKLLGTFQQQESTSESLLNICIASLNVILYHIIVSKSILKVNFPFLIIEISIIL